MQRHRLVLVAALAVAGVAAPASAQRLGSVEAGVFGQWTKLADSLGFNNPVGGGGRVGLFVLPNIEAEADIAFASATGQRFNAVDVTYRPARFGAVWNLPVPSQQVRLLVGGGYTLAVYKGDTTRNQYEDGVGGLAGLRFSVNRAWSVRAEFLADRFTSPGPNGEKFNTKGYWNFAVRAGVSFTSQRGRGNGGTRR